MYIAIRADVSSWIGSGHVTRCATLARRLREQGAEILFLCRRLPGDYCDWLEASGFKVHRLTDADKPLATTKADVPAHAPWLGVPMEQELSESGAVLAKHGPFDWLVVDHYALDATWERAMRRHAGRILVIDDLADRPHDCDLLLDQNLFADAQSRYKGKVPESCGRMLGPEFALLQPLYAELHERLPPRLGPVHNLLVFFGGGVPDDLTGRAIRAFNSLGREDLTLEVVVGSSGGGHDRLERLAALAGGAANIRFHAGLPSLAPLMARADLALGAGGATSWERCCLGLPALVITAADNQRPVAAELHARGAIRWLGHSDEVSEAVLARAIEEVLTRELPEQWSRGCAALVDGRGADRVVTVMMASNDMPLELRAARSADETLLLRWANDPVVRGNAFSAQTIDVVTHRQWFHRHLRDLEGCRIYIAESRSGMPVGQVRFERADGRWEVSYSLDALFRGRGLARRLLSTAIVRLRADVGGCVVFGRVRTHNAASRRVFESLGFAAEDCGGGAILYVSRSVPMPAVGSTPSSPTSCSAGWKKGMR